MLRKEIGQLQLIGVFSGKEHFVKLPNGDEFYPVTVAYLSRDIKNKTIKIDEQETVEAKFFPMHQLPATVSPMIRNLIDQLMLNK